MSFLYADKHLSGTNMPIVTPNSPEGIERAKWDRTVSQGGMRPDSPQRYPLTLYKASRPDAGNIKVSAWLTVRSQSEEDIALGQGWSVGQEAAIAAVKAHDLEHAKLAAERHFNERRMSEPAQREAAAADAATAFHVPVIEQTPIRKQRGRPRKDVTVG